ncbi:DUF368 domain-containing protein [Paenibacillus lemnae]|uniref:DUF368 domain-containing protein n=1 Tax=Paenibacillus lemnae TaxID=1330551 RepID=A0A848MBW3_PAELE|nr:DUF368 domain-containing protein [Paenibacillus lemnae]NMO97671.1 DUF368 domain-containing protein [Paenibacillus lemnae]
MEWKNIFRGFAMGTTDLIPGVSGGTLAVVLGIYQRLLEAISGLFSKDWKRHWAFIVPLGLGMVIAIGSLSRLIEYLLEHHYAPTQFFFTGLILGVLPMLVRQADVRRNFSGIHIFSLILCIVLMSLLAFIQADKESGHLITLNWMTGIGMFFAGWLASMAMLLPGVSGSFMLLMVGVYPTAINALTSMNFPIIMVIGAGVIGGFYFSSKGIRFLLSAYPNMMYAVMIGLIGGSVFVIFPGVDSGVESLLISVVTFLAGLAIAMFFGSPKRLPRQ